MTSSPGAYGKGSEAQRTSIAVTQACCATNTVPLTKLASSIRQHHCGSMPCNEVSATQFSLRRCHTNSTDDLRTSSSTHSFSSEGSKTDTEGGPSLLRDILRRLDSSSTTYQNATINDVKGNEATSVDMRAVPLSANVKGTTLGGQGGSATKAAYIPLLLRSDFMQAAALHRQQRSVPIHATTPVVSSGRSPARSFPEQASFSSSLPAVVARPLRIPPSRVIPTPFTNSMITISGEALSPEGAFPNRKKTAELNESGSIRLGVTAAETADDTRKTEAATAVTDMENSKGKDFLMASIPENAARNSETLVGTLFMGEKDATAVAVATAVTTDVTSFSEKDKQAALDELQADDEHEYTDDEESTSGSCGSELPHPATTSRQRRSGKLILDPVEWLAQTADTPLMDAEMLYSNTSVKDQLVEAMETTNDTYITAVRHSASAPGADEEENEEGISHGANEEPTSTTDAMPMCASHGGETAATHNDAHYTRNNEGREAELLDDLLSDIPRRRRCRKKERGTVPTSDVPSDTQTQPSESTTTATTLSSSTPPVEKPAVDPNALVYNVFTRRIAKASSPTIRLLSLIGLGVQPETRELTVTDTEALQTFTNELRAHRVSWPKMWSRGVLYRQLLRLLSDDSVTDTAERVAGLLRIEYNKSHLQRQQPGLVVGDGTMTNENAPSSLMDAASSLHVAPPMAENVDDKLLTLQDLNEEQQAVVELVMKGHHTYIGGGAGTGKSVLLRVIKHQLVREGLAVAVTGTTGIAGTQIGGCTLHHCFGITVSGEFTRRKDLSSYDVIIIDEVSMLSLELFESLEVHLRRANNVYLPFGGVQMILCGDFLQLGAIDSRPLITSPLFRRYFVQLKLQMVVRQNQNMRFAAQLQQLRRGQVPVDLDTTVSFVTSPQIQSAQQAEQTLKKRQQEQLAALLPCGKEKGEQPASNMGMTGIDGGQDEQQTAHSGIDFSTNPMFTRNPVKEGTSSTAAPVTPFVNGAVNLLPTNREVNLTNAQQLQQLPGELVTYATQFLPPGLLGSWSPTFILRIYETAKVEIKVLRMEIQRYLCSFYTLGQRSPSTSQPPATSDATSTVTNFSDGEWLLNPNLGERSIVLYRLFVDALVFRVRLPLTMDREETRQFLLHVADLDRHLETLNLGVRIRDVLTHGEGMHTEQDEYILSQYAARAPLAHSLALKVGARVMLRTNFASGLVNGSLGTVVGFRKLVLEELPRYLVGNVQREEAIMQYSNFLLYEQGFPVPIVPVVDFNGRQVPIPPMIQYVGGLHNTHYYSMGIVALPLSLAYAFTVHKVQGLTLVGRVHLELSRMWPCEHLLYVAMSRVRNPEQLSVSSFRPNLLRVSADCLLFDDSLPPVWHAKIAPYMLAATWKRSPCRRKKVLLKKKLDAYAKQQKNKLTDDARKGDLRAEIRLLEEKMLKQRAKAALKKSST